MASFHDDERTSPLLRAAYLGDLNYLKRFAKEVERSRDKKGRTALHCGAAGGRTQVCKYLIKNLKVDVDARNVEEATPLHQAILGHHFQTAVYLLENGSNPNAASKQGCTALHCAVKSGFKKLMQLLISKGADVNAMSNVGTPLHVALSEGNNDAVKFLLSNHADPNKFGNLPFSPLLIAIMNRSFECIKLLLQARADPNICSEGVSPLEMAVKVDGSEIIKCLLAAGANPDYHNSCGLTPLECAAIKGLHDEVLVLFPATAPIAEIADWSPAGVMKYVSTGEATRKREKMRKEKFLQFKSEGNAAFKREDYMEAINFYANCINLDPFDATVFSNRSLCWAKLEEGRRALADAQICVVLRPEWAKGHYREGVAWKLLEDFGKATNSFLAAWKLDEENKEIESAYYESVNAQAEYNKTRCPDELDELLEAFGETLDISE